MAFSALILARGIALRGFCPVSDWYGSKRWQAILENPVGFGCAVGEHHTLCPDVRFGIRCDHGPKHPCDPFFPRFRQMPLMSNLKVECVFPDSTDPNLTTLQLLC